MERQSEGGSSSADGRPVRGADSRDINFTLAEKQDKVQDGGDARGERTVEGEVQLGGRMW